MHLVASSPFDSVTEADFRVDPSSMFSDGELATQERWGAALEKTMLGYALCRITGEDRAGDAYPIAAELPVRENDNGRKGKFIPRYRQLAGETAYTGYGPVSVSSGLLTNLAVALAGVEDPDGKPSAFLPNVASATALVKKRALSPLFDEEDSTTPLSIMIEAMRAGNELERAYQDVGKKDEGEADSRRERGLPDWMEEDVTGLASTLDLTQHDCDVLLESNVGPLDKDGNPMFRFVGQDGQSYDTLEGAINSYKEASDAALAREMLGDVTNVAAADTATKRMQMLSDAADGVPFAEKLEKMSRHRTSPDSPYSFRRLASRVLVDTALSEEVANLKAAYAREHGLKDENGLVNPVAVWLHSALAKGGSAAALEGQRFSPVTDESVREGAADAHDLLYPKTNTEGEAKPSVGRLVGMESSATWQRMERSGFMKLLADATGDAKAKVLDNPLHNISFALESVFGKYDRKKGTGVKVERVTHVVNGVRIPSNVIRVTRFYKTKAGASGKKVIQSTVTYIAYGEMLGSADVDPKAYAEGIARAIGGDQGEMLKLLESMSDAERDAVARAHGLSINGVSLTPGKAGLTTTAFMTLTGLVKLGGHLIPKQQKGRLLMVGPVSVRIQS